MKVLIVDDEGLPRRMLAKALEQKGYEVSAAADGGEAWELFQASRPPMIVSDWNMPTLDGVELCRRVRSVRDSSYTYVILLTSRTDKESLVQAMAAGADDFISKPFDQEELHARMRAGERILGLAHEVARRMEHLTQANRCIKQINTQMLHDVKLLIASLQAWMDGPQTLSLADEQAAPALAEYKRQLRSEVQELIQNWVSTLPLEGEAAAPGVEAEAQPLKRVV